MLLAHKPKDPIVAIYMTSTFYDHRIPVMQRWADYVAETMGAVVPTTPQASTPQASTPQGKSENLRVQTSKAKPAAKAKPAVEAQAEPVPQRKITPNYSQDPNPVMQNWGRLLAETLVPVTPGVPA